MSRPPLRPRSPSSMPRSPRSRCGRRRSTRACAAAISSGAWPRSTRVSASAVAAAPISPGLEHQLKTMADEMQALRRASVQAESIETVRREVAELARTLSELAPRRSIETLERTIEALARRIDQASPAGPDESAGEIIEALKEIRGALADVRPAENFSAVERDLQALSSKLDQLNARGIDGATVDRLQAQTGEIRELLANALPSDALKALVGQIEMLVHKFEHAASPGEGAVLDVVNALERRIDTFAERVGIGGTPAGRHGGARRYPEPARANRRRARTRRPRRARRLRGDDEKPRREARGRRDEACQHRQSRARLERSLRPDPRSARQCDRRRRARHARFPPSPSAAATRFAEIEERRLGGTRSETGALAAPGGGKAGDRFATAGARRPRRAAPDRRRPGNRIGHQRQRRRRRLSAGARIRLSAPRGPQSAAQRIAQSEAALGGIASKLPESSTRTSDFIAAARRAAQAAAAEQGVPAAAQKDAAGKGGGQARPQAGVVHRPDGDAPSIRRHALQRRVDADLLSRRAAGAARRISAGGA